MKLRFIHPDMSVIKICSRFAIWLITVFYLTISYAGIPVTNPARQLEVCIIKAEKLPLLLGKSSLIYSLMAVEDGQLKPIPYQFDDQNLKGKTYIPGSSVAIDGTEEIIDPVDELAFMYKDMNIKADPNAFKNIEGKMIAELVITEDNVSRYAYVIEGNSQRSETRYTHYNIDTGYLETETYSLQFDPDSMVLWSDWKIKGFEGTESAPNILDTMKIRILARLGFVRATLHNGLVPIKMLGVKNGPVRSIVESEISIGLLGVKLLEGGLSVTFSSQGIEYPMAVNIPSVADRLSEFSIEVTMDYVDFEGSRYRSALGPKDAIITGQKVSNKVRRQHTANLENPWVSVSTDKNWDMFFMFTTNQGYHPKLSALYRDSGAGDEANEPERFEGSSAELGLKLEQLPAGTETSLNYLLYFGPGLWQGNQPEKAAFDLLNPAAIVVNQNLLAIQ